MNTNNRGAKGLTETEQTELQAVIDSFQQTAEEKAQLEALEEEGFDTEFLPISEAEEKALCLVRSLLDRAGALSLGGEEEAFCLSFAAEALSFAASLAQAQGGTGCCTRRKAQARLLEKASKELEA